MVMKKSLFLLSMLFVGMTAFAQGYYTRQFNDKKLVKTAEKWVKQGTWRQGFTKADPHRSLNTTEFFLQYQKNPQQWQALFRWLTTTDLLAIPAGKHPIEGTTLVASVEDSENGPLEKRGTESHYHHIDFQYVVKGVERFGIIDHLTSKPNSKWKPDVIHYNYDRKLTRFYDSTPDKFFIFFPCDWHIAKVNNDTNDQHIRVIVIKVDHVD
jgi:YhcH/YjgK/YiaL family protein